MRRADAETRYSEGFSPHQIMSFAAPLGVGLTGSGEYLDIEVLSTDSSKEMVRRLNDVMVEDMEILSYKRLPDDAANAMSLVAACDYETVVSAQYTPHCMHRRDRYMVDHASLLIAVFDGTPGGTQYTMQYAMSRRVSIVDLPLILKEP